MALKSVYLAEPVITNGIIQVTGEEHRHLAVARAEPGEPVEVFDGRGRVWLGVVVEVSKRHASIRVSGERQVPSRPIELILGLAWIQRSAFEFALEKAVEMGVNRIIPFAASRSNIARAERRDRWQRLIVEAAKQSKRFHLPVLDPAMEFKDILQAPAASKIMFAERDGGSLKSALAGGPVLFLVGPEGGWTEDELKSAALAGFRAVSLGAGILRSETAAIVGASLIRYELGDL